MNKNLKLFTTTETAELNNVETSIKGNIHMACDRYRVIVENHKDLWAVKFENQMMENIRKMVVNEENGDKVDIVVDAKELYEAIKTIKALLPKNKAAVNNNNKILIIYDGKDLILEAGVTSYETCTMKIKLNHTTESTRLFKIAFNPSYLVDIFKIFPKKDNITLQINNEKENDTKPMIIQNDKYYMFILPIRIKQERDY
jgi:hypothetical protein